MGACASEAGLLRAVYPWARHDTSRMPLPTCDDTPPDRPVMPKSRLLSVFLPLASCCCRDLAAHRGLLLPRGPHVHPRFSPRRVDPARARLCVDGAGRVVDTCVRDGARESYLTPADHRVAARLAGAVPPDASCAWTFD